MFNAVKRNGRCPNTGRLDLGSHPIYCSRFFSFDSYMEDLTWGLILSIVLVFSLSTHTHCFFYNILTLKGLTLSEYFRDQEGQDGTKLQTL